MDETVRQLPLQEQPSWRVTYRPEACNILELLAAVVGGKSPLQSAQGLIDRFGTLTALMNAPAEEIARVSGIGRARTAALKAAVEFGRRLLLTTQDTSEAIQSPDDAAAHLIHRMSNLEQEHLMVMLLNTRNHLLGEPIEIYHGSLNSNMVKISEVLRPAIRANAAAIIVAHNHPSGDPTPSPEDVAVTKAIVEAGKLVDIEVLDHLVIGRGRFVSLKSKGLGFE